jgi:hypothetical protein
MSARFQYQIQIISQQSAPGESRSKSVLITEAVTTRAGVVAIAARFQKIFPRPDYRVLVHVLGGSRELLSVDWESIEDPQNGPQ